MPLSRSVSGAVFLSYASQDAEAARRLCDALRAGGVEVWFDQSELRGGDDWDQKIKKQIRDCSLFLPVISAATQARREGYFRREWKLAADRTHDMAEGTPFLVPIVIDGTKDREALVPEVFLQVQWTRIADGQATGAFVSRVHALLNGEAPRRQDRAGPPPAQAKPPPGSKRRGPLRTAAALLAALALGGVAYYALHRPQAANALGQPADATQAPSARAGAQLPSIGASRQSPSIAPAPQSPMPGSESVAVGASPSTPDSSQPPRIAGASPAGGQGMPAGQAGGNLARAIELINAIDCTAEDCNVAENLARTALDRNPGDAAAATTLARVEAYILLRGYDRSEPRFAEAKRSAEQALALSPDDPDAQASLATYLFTRGVELPRAAKLVQQALERRPNDTFLWRMLDDIHFSDPKFPETEALNDAKKTAERFPTDALVQYDLARHYRDAGMLEETEHSLDVAIKLGSISNAVTAKARLALSIHGDVAGMKALLDTLPDRYVSSQRAVFSQFVYACASGNYAAGQEALRLVPETWLNDFDFTGPKELLAGELYLAQGKSELARLSFESAYSELGQHKNVSSANFRTIWLEPWLLYRTGRVEEARARNAAIFPEYPRPFRLYLGTNWWFNPILSNLLLGERDKAFQLIREAVNFQLGRTIIQRMLALDPRMAPWRGDPELAALLSPPGDAKDASTPAVAGRTAGPPSAATAGDAPGERSPERRVWPKNPDLRRAIELVEGLEAISDDFSLAEDIAKQAGAKAPADPEAACVLARVESEFLMRAFDTSDARAVLAKRAADRAVQLAPDDPEALYATAIFLDFRGSDRPRAERLLRRACELEPGEQRLWRALAETVFDQRIGEGLKIAEANVARFPKEALVHYDLSRFYRAAGRPTSDSEREIDATLALAPIPNAFLWKARIVFGLHGDISAMKGWLDKMPERVRSAERAVFDRFVFACLGGQPDYGLDALNGFPESWLSEYEFSGPTALLRGNLLDLKGQHGLARLQYEGALKEVQAQKAANPENPAIRIAEFWTLHGLGRMEEARTAENAAVEYFPRPYRMGPLTTWWFQLLPCTLLSGDRANAIQLIREASGQPEGRKAIQLRMNLDPRMAPWRDDKELVALLADPAGKP